MKISATGVHLHHLEAAGAEQNRAEQSRTSNPGPQLHNDSFFFKPMRGCLLCVGYLQRFTVGVVDVYERREAAVDGDSSPDEGPQSVGVGDADPKHLGQSKRTERSRVSNKIQNKTNIPPTVEEEATARFWSLTDLVCEHSVM